MDAQSQKKLKSIISPENIVVVGASTNPSKPGGSVTKNLIDGGYQGVLRVVNPKSESVMGLPTFPAISDLPSGIELAIIAIPAAGVRQALLDLAAKDTQTVLILTAGFGEVNEKGKEEERGFLEIAEKHKMTLIGPNCVGIITPHYRGKFAGIIPGLKAGTIDLISASGATVDYIMEQAEVRGLKFNNVISLGNSIQQGVEDILAWVDESHDQKSSKTIMLYMESIRKPQKLLKHARSLILKGCTIMGIKSGVTEAGRRAAASHTGAMSTSDTAVQALFDKSGIMRLKSKQEMVDVGCALAILGNQFHGSRACIVTDAGGPGVMLSDELNRQGWKLPVLKKVTQQKLLEVLPVQASVSNPIDCLPSQTAAQTRSVFKILDEEERENLDVIVILTGNSMLNDKWETYHEIIQGMECCSIPIIPMLSAVTTTAGLISKIKSSGKTYFYEEVAVGQALGKILKRPIVYTADQEVESGNDYNSSQIASVLEKAQAVLTPRECRTLLKATGIKTPQQVEVYNLGDLPAACDQLRFPVAMKVIGPLHKSDVGGVKIGLQTSEAVLAAWDQMLTIKDAEGVLLQEMVAGNELIMGVSKEDSYGHMIMFGLGGIYTEVLKDVSFKLCPLSREESLEMIRSIRAFSLLKGVRGEKGMSVEILANYLLRLSRLVSDFPQIKEIDLNPVKGIGDELLAVDSRILLA